VKQNFEEFLMFKHAEQYIGTKDCMVDDFPEWLANLDSDDFLRYGNQFASKQSRRFLEACKEAKRMYDDIEPAGGWQGVDDLLIDAIAEIEGGE